MSEKTGQPDDSNLVRHETDASDAFGEDAQVAAAVEAAGDIDWEEETAGFTEGDEDGEDTEGASAEPDAEASGEDGEESADEFPDETSDSEPAPSPDEVSGGDEAKGPQSVAWAKIVEAERSLQAQRDELKQVRHDLELKEKTFQEAYQGNVAWDQAARQDPIATLEKAGVNIDAMLEGIITGRASPVHQQNSELAAIKQELAQLKSARAQADGAQLVNKWRNEARAIFAKDDFQLLHTHPDPVGELETLCIEWHQRTGEVLPVEQGAAMLLESRREELRSTFSHPAVRKELGVPESDDSGTDTANPPTATTAPKTVTKNMRTSRKPRRKRPQVAFDNDDRMDRALAAIEKGGGVTWGDDG